MGKNKLNGLLYMNIQYKYCIVNTGIHTTTVHVFTTSNTVYTSSKTKTYTQIHTNRCTCVFVCERILVPV